MMKFREKKKPLLAQELGCTTKHANYVQKNCSIVGTPFQSKGVIDWQF